MSLSPQGVGFEARGFGFCGLGSFGLAATGTAGEKKPPTSFHIIRTSQYRPRRPMP